MFVLRCLLLMLRNLRLALSLFFLLALCSLLQSLRLQDLHSLMAAELSLSAKLLAPSEYAQSYELIKQLLQSPFIRLCLEISPQLQPYLALLLIRMLMPFCGLYRYLPLWLCISTLVCVFLRRQAIFAHQSLFNQKYLCRLFKLGSSLLFPLYVLQPFAPVPTVELGALLIFCEFMLLPVLLLNRKGLSPL